MAAICSHGAKTCLAFSANKPVGPMYLSELPGSVMKLSISAILGKPLSNTAAYFSFSSLPDFDSAPNSPTPNAPNAPDSPVVAASNKVNSGGNP